MTGRAETRVPFGAHAVPYAPGTLRPSRDGDPAAADRRVLDHYELWKAYFLRSGDEAGGRGRCAVFTPDAVTSGDVRTRAAARGLSRWARAATGGDPGRIRSGYRLDGTAYGDPGSPAFFAPFAVAALTEGEGEDEDVDHEEAGAAQGWLDALWARMCAAPPDPARACAAGVQLQSMLVVSHNYWVP